MVSRNLGFTAVELLFSLAVIAGIVIGIMHYTAKEMAQISGYNVSADAVDYARQSSEFLKTHYTALQDALTGDGDVSNSMVITIPPKVLRDDGFLNISYPDHNSLKQYPCLVVTYANNQLEAYLYYRSDGSSKALTPKQLHAGLEHVGGMIGIYQNGNVIGAGKTWNLDNNQTTTLFLGQGNTYPRIGMDTNAFKCQGTQIANNSFVISYASLLKLNNRLPKDDVLSQYPDPRGPEGKNDNTMDTNLNMDFQNKHNAVVFQMNPNCVMDPKQPATMQDYDPNVDGTRVENQQDPNNLGCKNRQLSIRSGQDFRGIPTIVITGFQRGGDKEVYDGYDKKLVQQPFVGELKAQSFQPKMEVDVGEECSDLEVGKMARQKVSGKPQDVNNLYVSQVICMQNPLCPENTTGFCYMPANSVTIKYDIPVVKNDKPQINPDAINNARCPNGMAMVTYTDDHTAPPPWGDHCCMHDIFGDCIANARANDHAFDGYSFSKLSGTNPHVNPFNNGVALGIVHYRYTCDAACTCPGDDAATWQPQVTSITCSNDINRVPLVVNQ